MSHMRQTLESLSISLQLGDFTGVEDGPGLYIERN